MEAGTHIDRADHGDCFSFSKSSLICDIWHCPRLVVALPLHHLQGSAESHSPLRSVILVSFAHPIDTLLALIFHLWKAQLLLHAFEAQVTPTSCGVSLESCSYYRHCYHFVTNLCFILSGFQDLSEKETEIPYGITAQHEYKEAFVTNFMFFVHFKSYTHIYC